MEVRPEIIQALHRVLRQKSDLESQIARGPRRIEICRSAEAAATKQLETCQQELKRLKLLAADRQLQLKHRETKLEDLKGKRNSCSSNREYSLLNDQIAADQQANTVLADEILDTLDSIDKQSEAIQSSNARLIASQKETAKVQGDVEQHAATLTAELARITAELRECEGRLPNDVRAEYLQRVRSKGEEAFAMVDSGSCGNCHQILTAHMLDQLSMGRVHVCSGCNSILYYSESVSV